MATVISSDTMATWVLIGLIVALVLVATITYVIAGSRNGQKQAQMKVAEQPLVHAPEEEKILLQR